MTHPSPASSVQQKCSLLHIIPLLCALVALGACSRKAVEATDNKNTSSSHTIRFCNTQNTFETEPLVVQVSESPSAFIWQFSKEMIYPDPPIPGGGIKVAPLMLADIEARAKDYKAAQDLLKKPAPVILTGDDRAHCDSLFDAIDGAKRAGITLFYLELNYRPPGRTGAFASQEGDTNHFTQAVDISGKTITITISDENVLYWGNEVISLEDYIRRLHAISISEAAEKHPVHFIIRVGGKTNYASLRYVADQIQRIKIKAFTLALDTNR